MMEETVILTNWGHFEIFYVMIRDGSWRYFFAGHAVIAVFGVLRFVWAYATAARIGTAINSTFFTCALDYIMYWTLYNEREREKFEQGEREASGKDKHIGGTGVDLIVWTIVGLIIIFTWPLLLPIMILFVPIQLSHLHFKRKKTFIANLKGEQLDT